MRGGLLRGAVGAGVLAVSALTMVGSPASGDAGTLAPPTWGSAETIVANTRLEFPDPQIVTTGSGVAVAVWMARTTRFGNEHVYAAVRPGSHADWGHPTLLSGTVDPFDVKVAASGPAAVTVAYEGFGGDGVLVATRTYAGGSWKQPVVLQSWTIKGGTGARGGLALAANNRGAAVAAWFTRALVRTAYKPSGAGWQQPRTLTDHGEPFDAYVNAAGASGVVGTVDGTLDVGVVWKRSASGHRSRTTFARAPKGRAVGLVSVDANAAGSVVVGWQRTARFGQCTCAGFVSYIGPNGSVARHPLDPNGEPYPQVGIGPHGVATIAWQHRTTTTVSIAVARTGAGGGWDRVSHLASRPRPSPCCFEPIPLGVAVNADGAAFVTLYDFRSTAAQKHDTIVVVRCPGASTCGPQLVLPNAHVTTADLAVEPAGGATLAWADDCVFDPILEECVDRAVKSRRLEPATPTGVR